MSDDADGGIPADDLNIGVGSDSEERLLTTGDFEAIVDESADATDSAVPPPVTDGESGAKPERSYRRARISQVIRNAELAIQESRSETGQAIVAADADERWLIRRGTMDFGPYSAERIREMLTSDEITENTEIIDGHTQRVTDLIDCEPFTDFVLDYIPKRQKRIIAAQERREEIVREVKKRGVRATISVTVGAVLLGLLGLLVLDVTNVLKFSDVAETVRPTPVEFPFAQVVRNYRYRFVVPQPEYQSISADRDLIASLFRPQAPEESSGSRRSRRSGSRGSSGDEGDPGDGDYVLDFDSSAPSRLLTQGEINSALSRNSGRISSCFADEMRSNPSFRGVTLTFSIRPDGRTFNIRVSAGGSGVSSSGRSCLVRAVRRIRFPEFNDVPMSVSYPFYVD